MRRSLMRFVVRITSLLAVGWFIAAQPVMAGLYVDNTLGEVRPDQIHKIAMPKPAQMLFEFRTDGATNAKATKYVKPILTEEVRSTGFVSDLSDLPVTDGARLTVIINNIVQKDAASKGFLTGFTFGLAGSVVADDYDVTISYVSSTGAPAITRTVHHRIYMKIGIKDPPPNATPVKKSEDAIRTMVRQAVAHALNDIASDSSFAATDIPGSPAQ